MTSIALNTFKKITLKQVLAPVLAITLVFSAPPIFASIASPAPSKQDVAEMKKIVGYYPEWGLYSGHKNYNPADMAINKMTHINYAFATIKNGEIAEFDTWAASGVTAQFGEAYNSEFKGALGQFKKLEAQFPQTSFMISIGGWTQSGGFHEVAATPQARQKFADSVVAFVRKWHFDGVDIDWEYPGVPRQPDKVDSTNDQGTPNADASERQTFTLLLKDLRAALDAAGQQDNTYYQLTAAVSANLPYIDLTDPADYVQYLDFVNLMTYDLHGAWDGKTNHQSALFSNPQAGTAAYSVHNTVSYFLAKGVPAEKLIIGSPFYSRGWKGVSDASPISGLPGLFASANGGAAGIWDGGRAAGNNPYWKLKEMEQDPAFIKYYDEVAQAPYLYSQSKQEMYTYEDTQSLGAKVSYVVNNDLGGIIFWEVTGDAPLKGTELLDVIYNGFYAGVVPPAPVAPEPPAETGSGATGEAGDTNGDTDASSGDAGAAEAGAWNPEAVYNGGDKVRHNGQRYQAKWWTQGNEPGTEQWGPWEAVNSTGNDGGAANNGDAGQVGGGQAGVGDGSGNTGQDAGQDASPETGAQAGYAMTQAELAAREAALTDSPQMTLVKETIRTLDNTQVESITPLRAENPANVKRVESLLSQAQFE
ncbi:MAG: glycosyl hydrolase family 18 protein [Hydrogenovibrio sp.]